MIIGFSVKICSIAVPAEVIEWKLPIWQPWSAHSFVLETADRRMHSHVNCDSDMAWDMLSCSSPLFCANILRLTLVLKTTTKVRRVERIVLVAWSYENELTPSWVIFVNLPGLLLSTRLPLLYVAHASLFPPLRTLIAISITHCTLTSPSLSPSAYLFLRGGIRRDSFMTGVLNLHFKLLHGEFFTAIRKDFILILRVSS